MLHLWSRMKPSPNKANTSKFKETNLDKSLMYSRLNGNVYI